MDGYRRAALTLHGLGEADRGWLLAQLPPADRARLTGLLEELRGLGMPADPALLSGLAERGPQPAAARLRAAPAKRMQAILAAEPARLAAAVLAIRREEAVAPQLAAALVSCIEARLDAEARQ